MNSHSIKWYSTDSEENYSPVNSGVPNYTKDEITYKFNSDKYRCDEFNLSSEFPILFMGCSITEGEGLPLNEVWAYHLHKKIIESTDKNMPFWSLAKAGSSIDYAARCYFELSDRLKPKYIFYLMSGISRREFCFDSSNYENWFPYARGNFKPSANFKLLEKIFVDPNFAYYQAYRSAMILSSVAALTNTKIFIFGMDMDYDITGKERTELFNKFDNIEYFEVPDIMKEFQNIEIPDNLKSRPPKARDNLHFGAVWHYKLYSAIWSQVKNKI